jgi:GTPase SAR1 family protein
MVYDITKRETFENLQTWLGDIKKHADDNVGIMLVGNKCDLEDKRQVSKEDGKQWADNLDIPFLETR